MAARLDSLRDDDVHARRRRSLSVGYGPDLMEDLYARGVSARHVRCRITPKQRKDGDALLQTNDHLVVDREVQKQIHTDRLVGQCPNPMDLLAEELRRAELRLQDTEAACVAHRGDQLR